MLPKIIDLEERFAGTGEPTLYVVARSERGRWFVEKSASYREKTASPAFEYIKTVAPKEGHTIVLVNALGAFETYDDNRNGDAFPARPYMVGQRATCGHAKCAEHLDGWINPSEVVTAHYKSFEKFGKVYKHHVNKDPLRSFGDVLQAFWNDRMQRVELLLDIVNAKDPELVGQINDGVFPAVSMGCHVRWDVCSVCGHRAATRREYCEHLDLGMRQIDPVTGKRHCALNPSPRFFDISIVRRPADPTGYMLKKVAAHGATVGWTPAIERGEKLAALEHKQASIRKLSDIQKELIGDVMAKRVAPDLALFRKYREEVLPHAGAAFDRADDKTLMSMAEYDVPAVANTLAEKGAALTCDEFVRLVFMRSKVAYAPEHLARAVAAQPFVREVLAQYPHLADDATRGLTSRPSPALAAKLAGWIEKRATLGEWLRQKLHDTGLPMVGRGAPLGPGYAYGAREPVKTDVMTMTDPQTGAVYKTTRGAAQAAADENYRSLLGHAMLLHGAYSLGLGLPTVASAPMAYASSKALHKELHPYHELAYQTDQGPLLAGNTEFVKSSAVAALNKLAFDYLAIDAAGEPGVLRKVAAASPTGAKLAAVFAAPDLHAKVALLFAGDERVAEDPIEPPRVDLDTVAAKLGALLVA